MAKKISLLFIAFIHCLTSFSQQTQEVEMADQMRSSGKIYVVAAVLTAIFAGIIAYLVRIDRKVSKLEKEVKDKE